MERNLGVKTRVSVLSFLGFTLAIIIISRFQVLEKHFLADAINQQSASSIIGIYGVLCLLSGPRRHYYYSAISDKQANL